LNCGLQIKISKNGKREKCENFPSLLLFSFDAKLKLIKITNRMPRIVCLSDTHNYHEEISVPDGDILIHAGDATQEAEQFAKSRRLIEWFAAFAAPLIKSSSPEITTGCSRLIIKPLADLLDDSIVYLQDSAIQIENLKIYGAPWQPRFYDWAFNLNRGREIAEKWRLINADTDVLITHGPPFGILDDTPIGDLAGCEELRKKVEEIRPRAHVFGHIHHGYGTTEKFGVKFVNASQAATNPTRRLTRRLSSSYSFKWIICTTHKNKSFFYKPLFRRC
jgi:Icc-related predicted phosphoesterase